MAAPGRVFIVGGVPGSLLYFRGALLDELRARGCEISAAAGGEDAAATQALAARGVRYYSLPLRASGLNPLADFASLARLWRILSRERPDVVVGYTLKPALWAVLAGKLAGVKRRVALIEGLGYAFTPGEEFKRKLVRATTTALMRLILPLASKVAVLNRDDRRFLRQRRLVRAEQVVRVPGIGVDLGRFAAAPAPADGPPTCLMISRLLRDKGVGDYVQAARIVRKTRPDIRFQLAGPDYPHPSGYSLEQASEWARRGWVEYLGEQADVRPLIAAAHLNVLPSYREGFPVSVMEAAAVGRASVVSDAPGCREAVVDGVTGLLTPVGNPATLAQTILNLFDAPDRLAAYGRSARVHAEASFCRRARARDLADVVLGRASRVAAVEGQSPAEAPRVPEKAGMVA